LTELLLSKGYTVSTTDRTIEFTEFAWNDRWPLNIFGQLHHIQIEIRVDDVLYRYKQRFHRYLVTVAWSEFNMKCSKNMKNVSLDWFCDDLSNVFSLSRRSTESFVVLQPSTPDVLITSIRTDMKLESNSSYTTETFVMRLILSP
jgi:hypothetical protein